MSSTSQFPKLNFENKEKKGFEFNIVSNKVFFKNKTDEDVPFKPHRISFYGILVTLRGEGFHFIDFNRYPYKRGTVFFLSKEQVHGFERNAERDAYLITFTPGFIEKNVADNLFFKSIGLFNYHVQNPFLQMEERALRRLNRLINMMLNEFQVREDSFSEDVLRSLLRVFISQCERYRLQEKASLREHYYYNDFLRFQQLLQEHVTETRHANFYSEKLNFSGKKLNRITQGILHQTAKGYISQTLTLEIKRLLVNTSLSIKEISYKCSFDEPTNFVKFFKANAGLTPMEFRKKILHKERK